MKIKENGHFIEFITMKTKENSNDRDTYSYPDLLSRGHKITKLIWFFL